jgi:rhodanese-related sulfurtransferase
MKEKFIHAVAMLLFAPYLFAEGVNLTEDMKLVKTMHKGKEVTITRNQDSKNRLSNNFTKTSRECPPFCIQPMSIGNVKSVGELRVFEFLKNLNNESKTLLLDVRTTEWYKSSTIPGSINLPFTMLEKDSKYIDRILKIFGANKQTEGWDFSNVQMLMIYSNGVWDAQATEAIESLVDIGYPEDKILYYRGGMQSWQNLGLTLK